MLADDSSITFCNPSVSLPVATKVTAAPYEPRKGQIVNTYRGSKIFHKINTPPAWQFNYCRDLRREGGPQVR